MHLAVGSLIFSPCILILFIAVCFEWLPVRKNRYFTLYQYDFAVKQKDNYEYAPDQWVFSQQPVIVQSAFCLFSDAGAQRFFSSGNRYFGFRRFSCRHCRIFNENVDELRTKRQKHLPFNGFPLLFDRFSFHAAFDISNVLLEQKSHPFIHEHYGRLYVDVWSCCGGVDFSVCYKF